MKPLNSSEPFPLLPLTVLSTFQDHPFHVREDDSMLKLMESIRQLGVLVPIIVRPISDGRYEIVSGHRRKYACEKLGLETIPAVIQEVDDTSAIIMMVDSNLHREVILPSEKARAYRMKLDAMKHQGARTDLTSDQSGHRAGISSRDLIASVSPDSSTQIQRYLRLNKLIPALLERVDAGKFAVTPAAEISYLLEVEQEQLLDMMDCEQSAPSLSQALRMKKLSQKRKLTEQTIQDIMTERKKPESWNLSLPLNQISKFFPPTYTPQKMVDVIIQLLTQWYELKHTINRK